MQRQIIAVLAFSCALIPPGLAQTPPPGGPPVPRMRGPAARAAAAAAAGNAETLPPSASAVGMDQSVITLKGECEPKGDSTPSKDCVSTVTRDQFEKLAHALQPGMSIDAKRQFATNLARLLVYSDAARALHLENDESVKLIMQFVGNQVLAEGLKRHYTEEFSHVSDQQVQDYYNQNRAKYVEVTLQRIFIPTNPGTSDKPAKSDTEQIATAEKFRERWVAGEDAVKLQQAAFDAQGLTSGAAPEVDMGARRPGSLPASQEAVFQLKAGEVSQVFHDPAASFIYKAVSVREVPVSEVKDSIVKTLQQQLLQDKMEEIGKSATPVLNDDYFGIPPTQASPTPSVGPGPGGAQQSSASPK